MSSTGLSLEKTGDMTRAELCEAFCKRLDLTALRVAAGSNFDARLLWAQRDAAYLLLAVNEIPIPMIESSKLCVVVEGDYVH